MGNEDENGTQEIARVCLFGYAEVCTLRHPDTKPGYIAHTWVDTQIFPGVDPEYPPSKHALENNVISVRNKERKKMQKKRKNDGHLDR